MGNKKLNELRVALLNPVTTLEQEAIMSTPHYDPIQGGRIAKTLA